MKIGVKITIYFFHPAQVEGHQDDQTEDRGDEFIRKKTVGKEAENGVSAGSDGDGDG